VLLPDKSRAQPWVIFAALSGLAGLLFIKPLSAYVSFAIGDDFYSHIVLIPFVSAYLVWIRRDQLPAAEKPVRLLALLPLVASLLLIGGYWHASRSGWRPTLEDYYSIMAASFLGLVYAAAFFSFGLGMLKAILFPLAFLLCAVPFPTALHEAIAGFLQHYSADTSHFFLWLSGMPLLRDGTYFQLPGFAMEVAPECSGIHSTVVLFITSLVAGALFLRSPWRRFLLAVAIIPLALLRNGLRIFTIGQLCVQIDPDLIDSYIHRQGGPIFFAFSLIPFMLVLLCLRKQETGALFKRK
jgi:exosortase C (VPDSG-CTERM-specific)